MAPRPRLRARVGLLLLAAAAIVGATAGGAIAGHLASGVKSYTGCLSSKGGMLTLVKEGNAPLKPCPTGTVQAHFSGGDITAITVGTGLTGGGTSGQVSVGLDPQYSLRQDCASGQVVKWDGAGWACANDIDTNTTYSAGTGLELSGTEFNVEPHYRLPQDCAVGEAAGWQIGASASLREWKCTQYAFASESCPNGEFVTGTESDGTLDCADPTGGDADAEAYHVTSGPVAVAGTTTILSKSVPAGNYLIVARVDLSNEDFTDSDAAGTCQIPGDETGAFLVEDTSPGDNATLTSVVAHTGGAIMLSCGELIGNFDVDSASMTLLEVDSIGP